MVSTPCDFSGELIVPIEKAISNNQLNLIINSFNGGYIGYITEDKWYDRRRYQPVRDLHHELARSIQRCFLLD